MNNLPKLRTASGYIAQGIHVPCSSLMGTTHPSLHEAAYGQIIRDRIPVFFTEDYGENWQEVGAWHRINNPQCWQLEVYPTPLMPGDVARYQFDEQLYAIAYMHDISKVISIMRSDKEYEIAKVYQSVSTSRTEKGWDMPRIEMKNQIVKLQDYSCYLRAYSVCNAIARTLIGQFDFHLWLPDEYGLVMEHVRRDTWTGKDTLAPHLKDAIIDCVASFPKAV